MEKRTLTADQVKELIVSELRLTERADVITSDAISIHRTDRSWIATIVSEGLRVDEDRCASVYEIGRRLADRFGLSKE